MGAASPCSPETVRLAEITRRARADGNIWRLGSGGAEIFIVLTCFLPCEGILETIEEANPMQYFKVVFELMSSVFMIAVINKVLGFFSIISNHK